MATRHQVPFHCGSGFLDPPGGFLRSHHTRRVRLNEPTYGVAAPEREADAAAISNTADTFQ